MGRSGRSRRTGRSGRQRRSGRPGRAGRSGGVIKKPIDRQKLCPLLLRVFLSKNRHHSPSDFRDGNTPTNEELQIYTWKNASLSELMELVRDTRDDCREKGTIFDFAFVFPDRNSSNYRIREVGQTCGGKTGPDDDRTLAGMGFQIGDYIDLAIRKQPIDQRNRITAN